MDATAFKPGGDYIVMTREGFEEMRQWMVHHTASHKLPPVPDVPFWPLRLKRGEIFDA